MGCGASSTSQAAAPAASSAPASPPPAANPPASTAPAAANEASPAAHKAAEPAAAPAPAGADAAESISPAAAPAADSAAEMKAAIQANVEARAKAAAAEPAASSSGTQSLVWIAGETCAGKTFIGDYLATRGYSHIDGDFGNQSSDPKVKEMWANLFKAMAEINQEGKTDEALWKPYYQLLIDMFNEQAKAGKNVALSFAILNLFGEKDWIAESIPGLMFFKVDVSQEIILERALVRNREIVELAGSSVEELWAGPENVEGREKYGEEFTEEGYRKWNEANLFSMKYIVCESTDDWITYLPNNNLESFEGIKKLNEALGLEWVDIDQEAVAQVNYERMKNFDLSLPT